MMINSNTLSVMLLALAVGTSQTNAFSAEPRLFSRLGADGTRLASTRVGVDAPYFAQTGTQGSATSSPNTGIPQRTMNNAPITGTSSNVNTAGPTFNPVAPALSPPVTVQGGSLKTWSLQSVAIERVEVMLRTEGRPLDADIDLWHGPDNTPNKMRVYVEDGSVRPFHAVIETPRGPNTVAVRNIGQLEFPMIAQIEPNPVDNAATTPVSSYDAPRVIQGGALKTYPFESNVESIQLLLKTDGRPLNARIELLQGPNNVKQVVELYIEDGMDRPFYAIIKTPGSGNVVRIVNTSSMEFPLSASIGPHSVGNVEFDGSSDVVLGGDSREFGPRDLQW